jgi:hypothetical protein
MSEVGKLWDSLIEGGYFTEGELKLITNINGYSIKTLNECIYARYGYRSLKQMQEE